MKDNNIFIKEGRIKIDPFDIHKTQKKSYKLKKLLYSSPEIWTQKGHTNKTDVWSIGCIIY